MICFRNRVSRVRMLPSYTLSPIVMTAPPMMAGSISGSSAICFFKLSRRRAKEAHIVLINHSLLVLELLAGGAGLPQWDGLIVDEFFRSRNPKDPTSKENPRYRVIMDEASFVDDLDL